MFYIIKTEVKSESLNTKNKLNQLCQADGIIAQIKKLLLVILRVFSL